VSIRKHEEAYRQIAHNIHLFVYVKLVDETWKGGIRRRSVSEIRQVIRAIEHGRPVTHLTYHATGIGTGIGFGPTAARHAGLSDAEARRFSTGMRGLCGLWLFLAQ
jgi:pilus assembly protein CpaF